MFHGATIPFLETCPVCGDPMTADQQVDGICIACAELALPGDCEHDWIAVQNRLDDDGYQVAPFSVWVCRICAAVMTDEEAPF